MTPTILAELRQLQANRYAKKATGAGSVQRPAASAEEPQASSELIASIS